MPFMLHAQLPEEISDDYTHHNSAGEHTVKHTGEILEINELRAGRGEKTFERNFVSGLMESAGVVAAHTVLADGGTGPTVGYVVSQRNPQEKSVDVLDLYVAEEHRCQGIGGFLLGNLLTQMIPEWESSPGVSVREYGRKATLPGQTYTLPGRHLLASAEVLGAARVAKLREEIPKNWSGIQEIEDESSYEASLYVDGRAIAAFETVRPHDRDESIMYRTVGGSGLIQT